MIINPREVLSRTETASLYIHIPFCISRCSYCAFFSTVDDALLRRSYIERVIHELHALTCRDVPSIYIGGGDPSTLQLEELSGLLKALEPFSATAQEITIEMNPEGITHEKLHLLERSPVTRISMGIQSFDPMVRSLLTRRGTTNQVFSALDSVRRLTSLKLSADIITAVEGTDPSLTLRDLNVLIDHSTPEHISVYELDIEEGTDLEKQGSAPSEHDHLTPAWQLLHERGYDHYELSNFCLPGYHGIHNLRYWDLKPYIGIGCSAVSTIETDGRYVRVTGIHDVSRFISEGMDASTVEYIDPPTLFRELIMVSLRTRKGIPLERIAKEFGFDAAQAVKDHCSPLEGRGIMKGSALTQEGMLFINEVTVGFFELADSLDIKDLPKY